MDAHHYPPGLVFHPPLLPGHVLSLPLHHDRNHHDMGWPTHPDHQPSPSMQGGPPSVHVFSVMNFTHDQRRASGDSTSSFISASDFGSSASSTLHPSTSSESDISTAFEPSMDYAMGSFRANIVGNDGSIPLMQANHSMMPWAAHGMPTESFQIQPQHQFHQPSLAFAAHPSTAQPSHGALGDVQVPPSEPPASLVRTAPRAVRYTPYGRRPSPTESSVSEPSGSTASSSHSSGRDASARTDINALPPPKLFGEAAYSESGAQKNRKKSKLMNIDRKQICVFAEQYPDLKQEEIASYFGVERSTVSKILKHKERWKEWSDTDTHIVAKFRPPKFHNLEVKLVEWCLQCKRDNVLLTDAMIRAKARDLAPVFGLEPHAFKASAGWLENFKNRRGIRKGVYHGRKNGREAQLAPPWRPPADAKRMGETDDEDGGEEDQLVEGSVIGDGDAGVPADAELDPEYPDRILTRGEVIERLDVNTKPTCTGPNGEVQPKPLISPHDALLNGKEPAHQIPHDGLDLERVTNMDAQVAIQILLSYLNRDLGSYGRPAVDLVFQLLDKLQSRAGSDSAEPKRVPWQSGPRQQRLPRFLAPGFQ